MCTTYRKATTREQVIKYIRELDLDQVRDQGAILVLPFIDKETKKIIVKKLKKLGIYHKVTIIVTNDVKKLYKKMTKDKVNNFHN